MPSLVQPPTVRIGKSKLFIPANSQQHCPTATRPVRRRPPAIEELCAKSNHNTPHGKRLITEDQDSFLRRFDDKVFLQLPQHPHGRQKLKHAVHLAQRDGRGDRQNVHASGGRNNPLPPLLVYSNVIDHLALRGTLEFFEPGDERLTEGFMTDEVPNYVETMAHIARFMRNKKATTGTVFMSPPGYVHVALPVQQFLYLVTEAAYVRELSFYIVAPNLRINSTTWRPCEASCPAFLAEASKALEAYTGYRGNSQMLADKVTAFDYGMEMARRSLDK